MESQVLVLMFTDKNGNVFKFTKKDYDDHKDKHFDLKKPEFFSKIKDAICSPTAIYPSYDTRINKSHKNRYCFYLLESQNGQFKRYTKVVVKKHKTYYRIITAYRPNNIKETKYFPQPCKRP
jgi:hypothetical protein